MRKYLVKFKSGNELKVVCDRMNMIREEKTQNPLYVGIEKPKTTDQEVPFINAKEVDYIQRIF